MVVMETCRALSKLVILQEWKILSWEYGDLKRRTFRLNFTFYDNVKKPKDAILSSAVTWNSGRCSLAGKEGQL